MSALVICVYGLVVYTLIHLALWAFDSAVQAASRRNRDNERRLKDRVQTTNTSAQRTRAF